MLGSNLPQGSQAITFQNTLFRVSELCWIKAVKLSVPELVVRVLAGLMAVAWIFAMKSAKGSFLNIECLLAVFPLILCWTTSGSLKIGCSGDFEEAYSNRGGLMQNSLFSSWITNLQRREPDWLHFESPNCSLLVNPNRVAWMRPCFQWRIFPLVVVGAYGIYLKLIGLGIDTSQNPILDHFQVLAFEGGPGTAKTLCWLNILVALAAFGLSIKRSVEICGTGGVQDVVPLGAEQQKEMLDLFCGVQASSQASRTARTAPKVELVEPEPEPARVEAPREFVESEVE